MISSPRTVTDPDTAGALPDEAVRLALSFTLQSRQLTEVRAMTAAELRLYDDPPDDRSERAQDSISCARQGEKPLTDPVFFGVVGVPLTDLEAAANSLASLASPEPDVMPVLTPAEQETARSLTLYGFYETVLQRWRAAQVAATTIKAATYNAEKNYAAAFDEWDRANPPEGWPDAIAWNGCPLSHLQPGRLRDFFEAQVGSGQWKVATAKSRWNHLRVVLSFAKQMDVLETVPQLPKFRQRLDAAIGRTDADDDDDTVTPYSDEELGKLFAILPAIVADSPEIKIRGNAFGHSATRTSRLKALRTQIAEEMQLALVLVANCGARASDWTRFLFGRHVRLEDDLPVVLFRAEKTGKRHTVPLAAVTIRRLETLRKSRGQFKQLETPLFPSLANPRAKKPLQSAAYRRSVKLLKAAAEAIGLDGEKYRCPWHAVRKSCTTRFNTHGIAIGAGMIGNLITHGPDADVASQSYDNRLPTIAKAVETIDWPF